METPEGLALRHELAGAGSRAAAALLDGLVWGTLLMLAVLALLALNGAGGLVLWVFAGILLSLSLYQIAFGIWFDGRTPGKWLLGIRVVDEEGFPATPVQHVLRGLFWPLEAVIVLVPVPLGIVLMATTPRKQRLGDMVAGTVVLRDGDRRTAAEPYRRDTWSGLPRRRLDLVPAHAARFDGSDLAFLRDLLGRTRMAPLARVRLLRESARHYAARLEIELPRLDTEAATDLLRELYLFLREMRGGALTRPSPEGAAAAPDSAPARESSPR